jgi:hypothetical protein
MALASIGGGGGGREGFVCLNPQFLLRDGGGTSSVCHACCRTRKPSSADIVRRVRCSNFVFDLLSSIGLTRPRRARIFKSFSLHSLCVGLVVPLANDFRLDFGRGHLAAGVCLKFCSTYKCYILISYSPFRLFLQVNSSFKNHRFGGVDFVSFACFCEE